MLKTLSMGAGVYTAMNGLGVHGGSIYPYLKRSRLSALADMDHVLKYCRHGLAKNIASYTRLMMTTCMFGYMVVEGRSGV